MISLSSDDMKKRFRSLFAKKFLVMGDERSGMIEIIEQYHARRTVQWDAMNRFRAGEAIIGCDVKGTSMTIRAMIGRFSGNFEAATGHIGGPLEQAEREAKALGIRIFDKNKKKVRIGALGGGALG